MLFLISKQIMAGLLDVTCVSWPTSSQAAQVRLPNTLHTSYRNHISPPSWPPGRVRPQHGLGCQRQNLTGSALQLTDIHSSTNLLKSISAIYLIAPEMQDSTPSMIAFADLAVQKHGVKRFFFLSGSSLTMVGFQSYLPGNAISRIR